MKVVIAGAFPESTKARIRECFPHDWTVTICRPEEAERELRDAEVLIPEHVAVDAALLEKAPRLKLVQTGAGYDNVDLAACTHTGVQVCNASGINAAAVAEHVMALILCWYKNIARLDRSMKTEPDRGVPEYYGAELSGKTEFKGSDQSRDDDPGQDRDRQVGEKRRSEEEDQHHGETRGQGHPLGSHTELICDPGTGNASVDGTAAGKGGSRISEGICENLPPKIQFIIMLQGEIAGGKQSFGENDHRDGEGGKKDGPGFNLQHVEIRNRHGRKSRRNGGQHRNSVFLQRKDRREDSTRCHDDGGHGDLRRKMPEQKDQKDGSEPEKEGQYVKAISGGTDDMGDQLRSFTGTGCAAKKLRNLHQNDRKTDPRDETTHNGLGYKTEKTIGGKKEEEKQPDRNQDRDHGSDTNGRIGTGFNTQRSKKCAHQRGRCRIYAEYEAR